MFSCATEIARYQDGGENHQGHSVSQSFACADFGMSAPEGDMKKARIILIAAMSRTRVIGADGGLPWKLPGDLAHFRRRTLGKPLILGRKTFESLGGPLPGREMIVLSRRGVGESDRVWSAGSKATALELAYKRAGVFGIGEICVIGGGEVFGEFLADADGLVLTWVEGKFEGDVFSRSFVTGIGLRFRVRVRFFVRGTRPGMRLWSCGGTWKEMRPF